MKKLTLLQCLLLVTGFISAQVTWQNKLPQGNNLNDIQMISLNSAYAVGDAGTIIFTEDGGENWTVQLTNVSTNLRSLSFISETEGWVISEEGFLLTTTNGVDWTTSNIGVNYNLFSISFVDIEHGWACGTETIENSTKAVILFTEDGGENWVKQYNANPDLKLNSIQFTDPWNGWACGIEADNFYRSAIILHTTDGGNTWIESYQAVPYINITNLSFVSPTHGFVIGNKSMGPYIYPVILKTENGGETWQETIVGEPYSTFQSIHFIDQYTGWVCGFTEYEDDKIGIVFHTNNGGQDWEAQQKLGTSGFNALNFYSDEAGIVAGDDGILLKSTNAGANWTKLNSGTSANLNSTFFINETYGYAAGSTIIKTVDGGKHWDALPYVSYKNKLNDIYFENRKKGWAIGDKGTLLVTENAGKRWTRINIDTRSDLKSIRFSDIGMGYIVGNNGTLITTTDGGETWRVIITEYAEYFNDVYFVDNQFGWMVGENGTVVHTRNGGRSWGQQLTYTEKDINAVHFFDRKNGLIVGNDGLIAVTNDGGITWKERFGGTTDDLHSICVMDYNVYVAGDNGYLLNSTSHGQLWSFYNRITNKNLQDVSFANLNTGWAVGDDGTILAINLSLEDFPGMPQWDEKIIDKSIESVINSEGFHNYPNPVTNHTSFRYFLSHSDHVTLRIVDINGRHITTLVDTYQNEGYHEINWNTSTLSEGIYFSYLQKGKEVTSLKLLVLN